MNYPKFYTCSVCEKEKKRKNLIKYKGKLVCSNCKLKLLTRIPPNRNGCLTLKKALDKTYQAKVYFRGKGKIPYCMCSFPTVLAFKKFKVTLVEK